MTAQYRSPDGGSLRQADLLVNGKKRTGLSGDRYVNHSPRDGSPLSSVSSAGAEDIDVAVKAARCAFLDGRWRKQAAGVRKQKMLEWARLVAADREHLGEMITLEMGKPLRDSLSIEVGGLCRTIAWYGELVDKLADEAHSRDDVTALVTREPAGVVGAVMPWNFPLSMIGYNVAPAIVVGNSVVVKPDEHTPMSTLRVAELALEAGIPPGVLNIVPGTGENAGRALGLHQDVDVLTFTGSIPVGRRFLQYASETNLKRVWLKMGGKTANIVLSDCPDMDAAVEMASWAAFFNQGEMCTAGSRLLLHESIHDDFLERLSRKVEEIIVGDPLKLTTTMGPVINEAQAILIEGFVDRAAQEGASLVAGGGRIPVVQGGSYFRPTIFVDVDPAMEIAKHEIFGPVLAVMRFRTIEEAVSIANATDYGLAAAIWTSDLGTAHRASRALQAGTVWVNCFEDDDVTVPFGGVKYSGFGRDKGRTAVDKYMNVKTTWMRLPPAGL